MSRLPNDSARTTSKAAPLAALDFGLALRVIGQNLSHLFPRVLEIELAGTIWEARGDCHPNPFETSRDGILEKILHKLRGVESTPPPAPPTSFTRRYRPADIKRLDRLYRNQRSGIFQRADIYTLAERLRTLGAIVDAKNGRLKHLRKEADRFIVEYWDAQDRLQSVKLTGVILYRNQQQLDKQRKSGASELWEGYDF